MLVVYFGHKYAILDLDMIILGNELLKRSNSDILKPSVRQRNQPPQTLGFTSRTRFDTLLFHAKKRYFKINPFKHGASLTNTSCFLS